MRLFNSNPKTILPYHSEAWRMTEKIVLKLQTFLNRSLHRILCIFWTSTISNVNLWEITGQTAAVKQQIMKRKWSWTGYTLSGSSECSAPQVLWGNPKGKRGRGRPRNSCRREYRTHFPVEVMAASPWRRWSAWLETEGIREVCQWAMLRNGADKLQIRSDITIETYQEMSKLKKLRHDRKIVKCRNQNRKMSKSKA